VLYTVVTFALVTIGSAANAKYSQIIWIDMRDTAAGPEGSIVDETGNWLNKMAFELPKVLYHELDNGCVHDKPPVRIIKSCIEPIFQIHRCFVIWNWHVLVVELMTLLLVGNISQHYFVQSLLEFNSFLSEVTASLTLAASSRRAVFADINFQLGYLIISVSTNIIFTSLVVGRLLHLQKELRAALGEESSRLYVSVANMVIESNLLCSCFGIIYVVANALHNCSES